MILHVNAFFIFYLYSLFIRIMTLISKSAQLSRVYLFLRVNIVNLKSMKFKLLSTRKCNKSLCQTILIIADIMRDLIVYFKSVIIFIVSIFILRATNMTIHMLYINMSSEFVLIKERPVTKSTMWMHKGNITKLIRISLLLMSFQSFICI